MALQIAIATVTIVFILSFFPSTPTSVYSSDDFDLSAIKPHNSPLALKSSSPLAPKATTTNRAHSGTRGKEQPGQAHDQPSQEKPHDGKAESDSGSGGGGGMSDTEKSNSGKIDPGKDNVGKTISGKSDIVVIHSGKVDKEDTHSGKAYTGKPDPGNADKGKTGSEETETEKTGNGKVDTDKTDDNVESDSGKGTEDNSNETKEQPSHNSKEDEAELEESESDPGSKFENLGTDKPETYKKPNRYGHSKEVTPRKRISPFIFSPDFGFEAILIDISYISSYVTLIHKGYS